MDVTGIVAVTVGGFLLFVAMPGVIAFASYKEKKLKLDAKTGGAEMRVEFAAMKEEVAGLRNRVAVLEKLATDEDRKLAQEITRLRSDQVGPRA